MSEAAPKILLVDDEKDLLEVLEFRFKNEGFEVLTAEDGEAALKILMHEKINVVISDIQMPGIDGIRLLDTIRSQDVEKPVVILTTGYTHITLEEAYNKGVQAVFSKPFDFKSLLACVRRFLSYETGPRFPASTIREIYNPALKMSFNSFNDARDGKLINIGRGGFFIQLPKENLPKANETITFEFTFSGETQLTLKGSGVVRWVRSQPELGLPVGCGIEFKELEEEVYSKLILIINKLRTEYYIPRT